MQQVRVKIRPRPRQTATADPPTIDREIARIWFPDSEQPDTPPAA